MKDYQMQLPCQTMADVLEHLWQSFPKLKEELFDESGNLDYIYQIVLNGKRILWPQEKQISVSAGDEIIFFAMMGGG
ncbi:MAG: MoaD/ThiS family protein [Firmicutes bacterium]|nr:MoaD/ThiS family protein [Bacillota bacterium]